MRPADNNISLLIDTTSHLILGLFDSTGNCVSKRVTKGRHADTLDTLLDEMLKENSIDTGSISKIVLSQGPGSFTGLRVGIAYAQGFCFPRKLPVYPFNSLTPHKILLQQLNKPGAGIISAKRGYFYAVFYDPESAVFSREEMVSQDFLFNKSDELETIVSTEEIINNHQLEKMFQNIVLLDDAYPFESLNKSVQKDVSARFDAIEAHYVQKPATSAKADLSH